MTNLIRLRQQLIAVGLTVGSIVTHHYGGKILDYKAELAASKAQELKEIAAKADMAKLQSSLDSMQKGQDQIVEKINSLIDKNISVPDSSLLEGFKKLEQTKEIYKESLKELEEGSVKVDVEYFQLLYKTAVKSLKAQEEVSKVVKEIVDNLNNKFVPDLNSLYDYLNSLNLLELSALFHLIVLSLICLLSINIISAVLGNEIINFFKLEQKFPKLSLFLKIRLKFQKYYLILSFSLLFLICILSIILDIFVLI
jgi:hypothetical protein